jgi:nucleotide-binding universal stress UspA family protein
MLQPKVILAPIDFSDSSLEALDVARDLAGRYGSEIVLVHAVPVIPEGVDILSETSDEEDLIDQA